jgi:hypothetical protein
MDGMIAPTRAGFDRSIIVSEGELKAAANQLDKAAKG